MPPALFVSSSSRSSETLSLLPMNDAPPVSEMMTGMVSGAVCADAATGATASAATATSESNERTSKETPLENDCGGKLLFPFCIRL